MKAEHFNGLTPAEAERLAMLLEEMGEAQQIIGKILRHGYESYHPDNQYVTNRQLLEKELGDVMAAADMMASAEDVDVVRLAQARAAKAKKVQKYLHHQPLASSHGERK